MYSAPESVYRGVYILEAEEVLESAPSWSVFSRHACKSCNFGLARPLCFCFTTRSSRSPGLYILPAVTPHLRRRRVDKTTSSTPRGPPRRCRIHRHAKRYYISVLGYPFRISSVSTLLSLFPITSYVVVLTGPVSGGCAYQNPFHHTKASITFNNSAGLAHSSVSFFQMDWVRG